MKENELKKENQELKKALSICINKPLVNRLSDAVSRIERGEFVSEKEFFRNLQNQRLKKERKDRLKNE